jgi:predicted transcriptional regulator
MPIRKEAENPTPPLPVKKSITPDFLISLEDGKPYKSLKRHLFRRGLTPAQYRAKWGLSADYPMVAPNYSKARSELANNSGLGQQKRAAVKKAVRSRKVTVPAANKPQRKKSA